MKTKLENGQTLFAYIPLYGVHEFQVLTISAPDENNAVTATITGRNKFTDTEAVLLALVDENNCLTFIKFLSATAAEEADCSHWYTLGEFTLYENPFRAYAAAVEKDIRLLRSELSEYEKKTREEISNRKKRISEMELGSKNAQFLLDYSRRYGLRNDTFKVHQHTEDFR